MPPGWLKGGGAAIACAAERLRSRRVTPRTTMNVSTPQKPGTAVVFNFHDFVENSGRILLRLHADLGLLKQFERELQIATRGRKFHIRSSAAWLIVLGWRDMFVIHFASWAKSMYV